MEKHELLAKVLAEIHSHSLAPYYSETPSMFWEQLDDISLEKDEVSKDFFITIAKELLNKLAILP